MSVAGSMGVEEGAIMAALAPRFDGRGGRKMLSAQGSDSCHLGLGAKKRSLIRSLFQ